MSPLLRPSAGLFSPGLAVLAACALLALPSAAQVVKQNGPLARYAAGGVLEAKVSPDGARYVYRATEGLQAPGLFSVRVDGSESSRRLLPAGMDFGPFELSSAWVVVSDGRALHVVSIDGSRPPSALLPRAPLRTLGQFGLHPDGGRVVYLAATAGGQEELFSAVIDADKQPIRLATVPPAGRIWSFAISPDGARVVYRATQDTPGAIELFSTSIDGSSFPVRLTPPFAAGRDVGSALGFGAGGARVVYRADQDANDVYEIYSAPVDGSASAVKLNAPLALDRDVAVHRVSADGRRVVYLADQNANERYELFGVPIDAGAAPVPLNGPLVPGGDVGFHFELSPDSTTVGFEAQQESTTFELYVAPIDGSAGPRALQPDSLGAPLFSPDGQRAVYLVPLPAPEYRDLYSVPLGRGDIVNLSPEFAPGQYISEFHVTPDGAAVVSVVYTPPFAYDLLATPLLGGPPLVLGEIGSWDDLTLSRDGRFVVFQAEVMDLVYELRCVPVDGHRPMAALNGPLVTDHVIGDVTSVRTSPQGATVFTTYVPDRGSDGDNDYAELFGLASGLVPAAVQLGPRLRRILEYEFDAGGQRVVFRGGDGKAGYNLFSAPADGHSAPLRLDDPDAGHDQVERFVLDPAGAFAVFDARVEYWSQLFRVELDGGPEVPLTGPLPVGGRIQSYRVAPGSARVVYVADALVAGRNELFSVASDGSAPALRLNGPLPAGGDVGTEFLLTPDGQTVVAFGDLAANGVNELFRVPVDGSSPPLRISAPLVAGGDVAPGFRLGPDGTRVVYLADQELDERFELQVVALQGGTPPVKVSGALVAGGDVQPDLAFTPDGTRVVYRADGELDERFELFVAPLDGSSAPLRLNPPLVADGDVRPGFLVARGRVVYRADREEDERIELLSSALGGAGTFVLNDPLPPGGAVLETLRLGVDGRRVLYVADQRTSGVFQLFEAPVHRPKRSRLVSAALVAGGDVGAFEPTADGKGVLYLADQETDGVVELFLAFLAPPRARAR